MTCSFFFFFNDTATTEIYTYWHTLSLHDALPISRMALAILETAAELAAEAQDDLLLAYVTFFRGQNRSLVGERSEEHTSELQSLMRISYAVFCLKKKTKKPKRHARTYTI